jgi:hypothetical protein
MTAGQAKSSRPFLRKWPVQTQRAPARSAASVTTLLDPGLPPLAVVAVGFSIATAHGEKPFVADLGTPDAPALDVRHAAAIGRMLTPLSGRASDAANAAADLAFLREGDATRYEQDH